jgi:hypothetical protein
MKFVEKILNNLWNIDGFTTEDPVL